MVSIYEQKGDGVECESYKGMNLMEQAMKVLERVVGKRLREIVDMDGMHFGVRERKRHMPYGLWGRSKALMLERNKNLYCAFVDTEKAFDKRSDILVPK